MSKQKNFKTKEPVVYPGQGVGEIVEISDTNIGDEVIKYYVVYLHDLDMTVLIPVDKSEELGLRSIVSKGEAEKAIEFLSEECEPMPSDWKLRYQMNMDLFKSGAVMDIASVVRSLYHRGKVKELPIQERKLYESAYKIFQDEITTSLKITSNEAELKIHKALEPFPNDNITQSFTSPNDDFDDDSDEILDDDLEDVNIGDDDFDD